MKDFMSQLSEAKSQADKREFVRGALGVEKFDAGKFAAGFIAGWLLTPRRKK